MAPVLLRPLLSSTFWSAGRLMSKGRALLFADRIELHTTNLFRRSILMLHLQDVIAVRWNVGPAKTRLALESASGVIEIDLAEGHQWHALLSERLAMQTPSAEATLIAGAARDPLLAAGLS